MFHRIRNKWLELKELWWYVTDGQFGAMYDEDDKKDK
jgi:hypothetical protein